MTRSFDCGQPNRLSSPCGSPTHGELSDTLVVSDGTRVGIRPLGPGDRDSLAALFASLSAQSRQQRFFSPKPRLTQRELAYLTDIDHVHHEALAAIDQGSGTIVGVARYVHYGDWPKVAELAAEVADSRQNLGIGAALAERAVQRARDNGLELLTATTLWANRPARALLRRLGFRARASRGGQIVLELRLDAPGDGSPRLGRTSCRGSRQ